MPIERDQWGVVAAETVSYNYHHLTTREGRFGVRCVVWSGYGTFLLYSPVQKIPRVPSRIWDGAFFYLIFPTILSVSAAA